MASLPLFDRMCARWRINRAIKRLVHPNERVRNLAQMDLRAASPRCWKQLRRAAFRPRTRLAVVAADLLDQLGDPQGLIALLSQYADPSMHGWYDAEIRRSLQRIGIERVIGVLQEALDYIEAPELTRHHWSLSVAVYTLFTLQSLRGNLPTELWLRALIAAHPGYEELRTCRSVLPSHSYADLMTTESRPPSDDWRVGTTLVAVRRSAVEALTTVARREAFDLLRAALAHTDPQVQCTAIYGLRRLRDPRALVLLQRIAADRRHPLARDARRAIEAFGSTEHESLTLVRASDAVIAAPNEMLRAADAAHEIAPETLLRAVAAENQNCQAGEQKLEGRN